MVSRVSHTTFDCRDAFEISTFWKQVKDRVHLDLEPTDRGRDDEIQRVLALGATALHDLRKEDGSGWQVLADPAGNEFCILRSHVERDRPR